MIVRFGVELPAFPVH